MNITKKKKIKILQKALGGFVQDLEAYSCNAVWASSPLSIADEMEDWYGEVLAKHSGLQTRDGDDLVVAFTPDNMHNGMPEFMEHRMMWLAWLITMLREGLES